MPPLWSRIYWTAFTAWHTRGQSQAPFWPSGRLLAVQAERVRRIVAHAYATVPFYRDAMQRLGLRPADIRSADDLALLPVVSSHDLATEPELFHSRSFPPHRVLEKFTSGTTGHRRAMTYDHRCVFLSWAEGQRRRDVVASLLGKSHGARVLEFRLPGGTIDSMTLFLDENTLVPGGRTQRVSARRPRCHPPRRHGCSMSSSPTSSTATGRSSAPSSARPSRMAYSPTGPGSCSTTPTRCPPPTRR